MSITSKAIATKESLSAFLSKANEFKDSFRMDLTIICLGLNLF